MSTNSTIHLCANPCEPVELLKPLQRIRLWFPSCTCRFLLLSSKHIFTSLPVLYGNRERCKYPRHPNMQDIILFPTRSYLLTSGMSRAFPQKSTFSVVWRTRISFAETHIRTAQELPGFQPKKITLLRMRPNQKERQVLACRLQTHTNLRSKFDIGLIMIHQILTKDNTGTAGGAGRNRCILQLLSYLQCSRSRMKG